MNLNSLKSFARQARTQLIEQISARLSYVLHEDSGELRLYASAITKLKEQIQETSRQQVVEAVAYTWFNRFLALRFMDANDYQPLRMRILSPAEGMSQPELLDAAKQFQLPEKLQVDRKEIRELLDGSIPHPNPQEAVYRKLLVAVCNDYHQYMPFLFQPIRDYTELLLPEDLLSPNSLLAQIRENLDTESCQKVEVIGWMYQFYISEKKEEIDKRKDKVKSGEIPAVTQLFTPHWIVRYMVENSLGRLWLQSQSRSQLREEMPYYVAGHSSETTSTDLLKVYKPEEIKILDPACGSGHILVYAFDLLCKIYEEAGYNPSQIPQLILQHNLYGIDIDPRAASLAAFALLMKARAYYRRLFFKEVPQPNILALQDIHFEESELQQLQDKMGSDLFSEPLLASLQEWEDSSTYGSLIRPSYLPGAELPSLPEQDLFLQKSLDKAKQALLQAQYLSPRYHCVIANPPYMGGGKMDAKLKNYMAKSYKDSKSDLMTAFIERIMELLLAGGLSGTITLDSWMFLSSYEKLREKLLDTYNVSSLMHVGWNCFPHGHLYNRGVAFTLLKSHHENHIASFVNLSNVPAVIDKHDLFLRRIESGESVHHRSANDFSKIPGSPIAYWVSERVVKVFEEGERLGEVAHTRLGMATGSNSIFVRFWHEVSQSLSNYLAKDRVKAAKSNRKWFPYSKGGDFRKWYGNLDCVVDWENDGSRIRSFAAPNGRIRSHNYNLDFIFRIGITWSALSSGSPSMRILKNALFDNAGSSMFIRSNSNHQNLILIGFLNSKLPKEFLQLLSPTLNYQPGDMGRLPILGKIFNNKYALELSRIAIEISKNDWDCHEISWDFKQSELLNNPKDGSLKERYIQYKKKWKSQLFKLHTIEEELNRIFIKDYGLENEISSKVPFKDVTILQGDISRGEVLSTAEDLLREVPINKRMAFISGKEKIVPHFMDEIPIPFKDDEIIRQLISYAVGCMFGRYSLDNEGLILANQGESLEDYIRIVYEGARSLPDLETDAGIFLPDDDNIIPVLEEDFFEDDIVGRFRAWLRVAFGEEHYGENLAFVEEALGKELRSYFVRDFYPDHLSRYKKRPIYWLVSSPGKSFSALIYLHRYRPDTLNRLLNEYLREYRVKLLARDSQLAQTETMESSSAADKARASKARDHISRSLQELEQFERDQLYPLASQKIELDLDDGVKVNYEKLGRVLFKVKGLNV